MRPASTGCSRVNPGSPNFRARHVPACQGHRPRRTPTQLAIALRRMFAFRLVVRASAFLKFGVFRGSINLARSSSCQRFRIWSLRHARHELGAGVFRYAFTVRSFIRYILPARCLRIGLALRHVTPEWVL